MMRYHALATDYDGTLAHDGRVDEATIAALERLLATGRRLILVTGRQLDDLLRVFPRVDLCTLVVAENGALLYRPASREERLLGEPPPDEFVAALRARGVTPLGVGRSIVDTWRPNETVVLETIQELGLEHQVIFNKGAVMVLPPGVNKASGLHAALDELGLSAHNAVGVGDAENDHAFLTFCECAVVVANALPALKERADVVTAADHGAGVIELIDHLIADDLAAFAARLARHGLPLGTREGGEVVTIPPATNGLLFAGPSASGKSTAAAGLLERLVARGYQCCLVDPEGDFTDIAGFANLGGPEQTPTVDEVLALLERPDAQVAINLLGLPLADRPAFFAALLPRLLELRSRTGRPHWIAVDEAHTLLPAEQAGGVLALPEDLDGLLLLTVHPDRVARPALAPIDYVIAVGEAPDRTFRVFAAAIGQPPPAADAPSLAPGEALVWVRRTTAAPFRLRVMPDHSERRRHRRKYATGKLGEDNSFYFRGPAGALKLRAQNLEVFLQLAAGVDADTWLHHLRRGDYSRWFRERIKDEELADEVARIEARRDLGAAESRREVADAIERRYTLPA